MSTGVASTSVNPALLLNGAVALIVVFLCTSSVLLASDSTSAVQGEEVSIPEGRYVVQSLWRSRELIRSGRVEIATQWNAEGSVALPIDYTVWFDAAKDRLRVDRREDTAFWQTVRRPEWLLIHAANSAVISKEAPDFITPWPEAAVLDPRVPGLTQRDATCGLTLEILHGYFPDAEVVVRKIGEGKHVLTWTNHPNALKGMEVVTRIWTDEQKGSSPIRVEQVTGMNGRFPAQPDFITTTEYVSTSGIWLPSLCQFDVRRNGKSEATETWTFKWANVNEVIAEEIFTAEGLNAPGGTLIADSRQGDPIVEAIVPRDGVADLPGGRTKSLGADGLSASKDYLFLGINAFAVLALTTLLIRRRMQRSSIST